MAGSGRIVLLAGRACPSGGLGRVLANIADGLAARDFEVHVFPFDDPPYSVTSNVLVHPGRLGGIGGEAALADLYRRVAPATLIVIDTYERVCILLANLRQCLPGLGEVFVYLPLDGEILDTGPLCSLGAEVKLVLYTHAALASVRRRLMRGGWDRSHAPREVFVIGHGVQNIFRPLPVEERAAFRQQLLPRVCDQQAACVVLNANRNQLRKRIDITLAGFRHFASEMQGNAWLVLHMERRGFYHAERMAAELGIHQRVVFTDRLAADRRTTPDEVLNQIYNAADVGLNTSMAEGWGMVAFEHARTGAAQVMTHTAVSRELWDGSAVLVPAAKEVLFTQRFMGVESSVEDTGESLFRASREYERMGALARKNASRHAFQWDSIIGQWAVALNGQSGQKLIEWSHDATHEKSLPDGAGCTSSSGQDRR